MSRRGLKRIHSLEECAVFFNRYATAMGKMMSQ